MIVFNLFHVFVCFFMFKYEHNFQGQTYFNIKLLVNLHLFTYGTCLKTLKGFLLHHHVATATLRGTMGSTRVTVAASIIRRLETRSVVHLLMRQQTKIE